jgi:hypothetical protein
METKPVQPVDEKEWAKKQEHINNVSTAATAIGATALGTMLAGKTKAGKKILGVKLHHKLQSGRADDLRNSIALASMISGVASGVNWQKKLRADAEKPPLTPRQKAANIAAASQPQIEKALLEKGIRSSTVVRGLSAMGLPVLRTRKSYYRRTPLTRPRLRRVA